MARLAWVEILDRQGDVQSRHAIDHWPCRIGRGYECHVILNDPHVSPVHLEIRQETDDSFHLQDLNSLNGTRVLPSKDQISDIVIEGNDIVRIGQTQLRIRPVQFQVQETEKLVEHNWLRKGAVLAIALTSYILISHMLNNINNSDTDSLNRILGDLIKSTSLVSIWGIIWAITSRIFSGKANLIANMSIGFISFSLYMFLNEVNIYAAFMFDSGLLSNLLIHILDVLFGYAIYRHVRLISRASRARVGVVVAIIWISFLGIIEYKDILDTRNNLKFKDYMTQVGPATLVVSSGISKDDFINDYKMKISNSRNEN